MPRGEGKNRPRMQVLGILSSLIRAKDFRRNIIPAHRKQEERHNKSVNW
jgi:hypothetical protein